MTAASEDELIISLEELAISLELDTAASELLITTLEEETTTDDELASMLELEIGIAELTAMLELATGSSEEEEATELGTILLPSVELELAI
jgi:hypothetical protein